MFALFMTVAIQAEPIPTPPVFEFKGIKAGEKAFFKNGASCEKGESSDERTCTLDDTHIADRIAITTVWLYKDQMTMMMSMYDSSDFPIMLAAFKQKYGEPCETRTEPWKNRMGTTLDSEIVTWCFSTGKLKLKSLGYRASRGEIDYDDDWKAPTKPLNLDF